MTDAPEVGGLIVAAARPRVRAPRSIVRLNGQEVDGWIEWNTEANVFYQADTFRVVFAANWMTRDRGSEWLLTQREIKVELLAGVPEDAGRFTSADLESVFLGRVDDLDWDMTAGRIELTGRDLTADMLEAKTSEKFPNKRASDIAREIATRHGLDPKVTGTTARVGKYYSADAVRLQSEQTEWDLLTWLAREEGLVCYVRGRELHFGPRSETEEPHVVTWEPPAPTGGPPRANATRLSFTRSLALARDIKVTVKTWNAKQKRSFTKTARTSARTGATGSSTPQEYSYTIPGLTAEEAQARANHLLAEVSAHQMRLTLEGPANNGLRISQRIKVQGTGTAVDQLYFPDAINRTMTPDGGYSWRITAKNRDPESEPTL